MYAGSRMDHRPSRRTDRRVLGPAFLIFAALTFTGGVCRAAEAGPTIAAPAQTPLLQEANSRGHLSAGWATADITPPRPVALIGQLYKRISTGVRDPLTATVLALETQGGDRPEQAILVSCDLLFIQRVIQQHLQEKVRPQLPEFDSAKLFVNATHTHTGPGLLDSTFKGLYDVSQNPEVMRASEYADFLLDRVAEAVVRAWSNRKPASMAWAVDEAVISHNRRTQFRNGSTVIYGNTRSPDFTNVEGPEDHEVNLLFFWGANSNLTGVVINLACTAQETEHLTEVSADFWHEVRQEVRRRHGTELFVLPQCAPAGDLSPHLVYRQATERAMDQRRGLSRRQEIARRIANAVGDALPIAAAARQSELIFQHTVAHANLPEPSPGAEPFYETDPVQPIEFHVLRLGDVAMATCPFELYVDYATRIHARSAAVPTMLVQLCGGASGYLPTARAVQGGGYSADKFRVGPEGGQVLVEETVRQINGLFPERAAAVSATGQEAKPTCTVDAAKPGAMVAPICRGQQLEEFNYQFEGGLYAQLINNPSFEELGDPVAGWTLVKPGSSNGSLAGQTAAETQMLNSHQAHCARLEVASVASGSVGLANGGYWGMGLRNNTTYKASFWARKSPQFSGTVRATLEANDGTVYAQSPDLELPTDWKHFNCDLTTRGITNVTGANRFALYASGIGQVYFDVVTLMPPTWKDRPNGLRLDLAEKLAALKLKYIQFPGGCTAESANMEICWNWKNSIGPLEERPGSTRNRWGYKNDLYFGLDEYLQLCEDLGAEPVYVTSSGISENPGDKEWYGLCPLEQMEPIITDILDLLEYCKGPATSKWGAKRAANGHPAPYDLKYIEIGNENGWGTVKDYIPRYTMIHDAIRARYPDMKIMFNATGVPSPTPEHFLDYADDHFYEKDLSHLYDKYDHINPACNRICVAEYASSIHGNGGAVIGNFGDALGDAVFMLGCEKNSERMWWTGYGNYAGLMNHGNFGPCIVWNDAVTNFATPSYYMQKMLFTDNAGTQVLPFTQNTTNCFWSASLDTAAGKHDVLLKVVAKSAATETVRITLSGLREVKPLGHFTMLTGALDAENSLVQPHHVMPSSGTFVAGVSFDYTFPAWSITVLRLSSP
jgi:alpha-L-arabinofuranosidase